MSWGQKMEIFDDVVKLVVEAERTLKNCNGELKKDWVLHKVGSLSKLDTDTISAVIDLVVTIANSKEVRSTFTKGCAYCFKWDTATTKK